MLKAMLRETGINAAVTFSGVPNSSYNPDISQLVLVEPSIM